MAHISRFIAVISCILVFSCIAYSNGSTTIIGGGEKGWGDWKSTGDAWQQVDRLDRASNPYPGVKHVESSEKSVGTFRSPSFVITGDVLEFWANGWDGRNASEHSNMFTLRSAKDGTILRQVSPPLQDSFALFAWQLSTIKGQEVYFEAVDAKAAEGFAWVGLASVVIKSKEVPADASPYRAIAVANSGIWAVQKATGGLYIGQSYLSSVTFGEAGTGEIVSPVFTLSVSRIRIKARGWDGSMGNMGRNLILLQDSKSNAILRQSEPPTGDAPQWMEWDTSDLKGRSVQIRVIDSNSDSSYAWLGIDEVDAGTDYHVNFSTAKTLEGWQPKLREPEYCDIAGVPFLATDTSMAKTDISSEIAVGCKAKQLFFIGMTTSLDQGNFCWWSPMDYSGRFFIGDKIGAIKVNYADGVVETYPLTLGESLWWGKKFTQYSEPFASDPAAAKALKDSLHIYPAKATSDGRYLAAITPRAAVVKSVDIIDYSDKKGVPVILGLTVEPEAGVPVPNGVALSHDKVSADLVEYVKTASLRREGQDESATARNIAQLREALYTTTTNFPQHVEVTIPDGYKGPQFKFEGNAYAEVLTNIMYANIHDIFKRVDAQGMYHTSAQGAASYGGYEGFGSYRKGVGSYYTQSWTRDMGRSLGELCAYGYLEEGKRCAEYTLAKARVWEQRPELRFDGTVLPRHICRVLQYPSTDMGQGCFENDGQGLTSLFVYNLWRRLPDRDEWLKAHWDDVQGLGDWVVWQFANPKVSGAKEVLRTDSECAAGVGYSVYADVACMEALRGLADMAISIGRINKAAEWRALADKMRVGCESAYVVKDPKYGKMWTMDSSGWPNNSTVMGPVIIPSDRIGFLGETNDSWLSYNQAAYQYRVDSYKPFGYFGVAMGYGQGFITQSALLLDKMSDATKMLQWAAKQTYSASHEPYIVPEGCEIDPTGQFWHRTGDLGNGVQQAEIVKAIRLVIGIDDSSQKQLTLCPRMPYGWEAITVGNVPTMIDQNGKWATASLGYTLKKTGAGMAMHVTSDKPLPKVDMRLGPLRRGVKQVVVTVNGSSLTAAIERSGDSSWTRFAVPAGEAKLDISLIEANR